MSSAKGQKELNEVCCSLWPLYNDYFSIPPNNRNQQLWSCLVYPYRLSSLLPYISHPTINTRWPMIYIIWPMDYMMLPMIIGSLLFVYTKLNCMHIVTLVQSCRNQILHKLILFLAFMLVWDICYSWTHHLQDKVIDWFWTSLFWKDYKWRLVLGLNENTNLEAWFQSSMILISILGMKWKFKHNPKLAKTNLNN